MSNNTNNCRDCVDAPIDSDDNSSDNYVINYTNGRGIGAVALWVVLFWGDPDISDAIIYYLSSGTLI